MFDDIPEAYRNQTADNEEEGWRYTQGDKSARRPPELLTRDHVARCINREVKAGRGSPHGGVFLDIAWIKKRLPNAEDHIKRKLPSMYHQFKQLADIDITKEPMEIGPTTHYVMGGVRVDADTQMSTRAGPVRGRRMRGRDQRREPARRQLAVGPARVRQARGRVRGGSSRAQNPRPALDTGARGRGGEASARAVRAGPHREPVYDPARSAGRDAAARRHRPRWKTRCARRSTVIEALKRRAALAAVHGHREYNPGWHTALDLRPPADRLGGDRALRDRAQGEPRRPLPRGLSRRRRRSSARSTSSCGKRAGRRRWSCGASRFPRCRRS